MLVMMSRILFEATFVLVLIRQWLGGRRWPTVKMTLNFYEVKEEIIGM